MSDISNFVLFRLKNLKLSPPPDSGGCTGAELQDPPLYAHFSHMFSLFCRDCLLWHKFFLFSFSITCFVQLDFFCVPWWNILDCWWFFFSTG